MDVFIDGPRISKLNFQFEPDEDAHIGDIKKNLRFFGGYREEQQNIFNQQSPDEELDDSTALTTLLPKSDSPGGDNGRKKLALRVRVKTHPSFMESLTNILVPSNPWWLKDLLHYVFATIIILACFGFMWICTMISFYLPWDTEKTVPVTMQTFAVLVMGSLFGRYYGVLSLLFYVFLGCYFNVPVFSGFNKGWDVLKGPTGGYIVGFFPAVFLIGLYSSFGYDRKIHILLLSLSNFLVMLVANVSIYLFGLPWLAWGFRINEQGESMGFNKAFKGGCVPFLVGDLLKIILAMICVTLAWKIKDWIVLAILKYKRKKHGSLPQRSGNSSDDVELHEADEQEEEVEKEKESENNV